MRVLVFNENHHELTRPEIAERYPLGIHGTVAAALAERLGPAADITTATQDEPGYGLTKEAVEDTDVLVWWSHLLHAEMDDETVDRIRRRVLDGMVMRQATVLAFERMFLLAGIAFLFILPLVLFLKAPTGAPAPKPDVHVEM